MSSENDTSGGYLVAPHILKRIHKNINDLLPMRQICSHQKISTEALDYIIEGNSKAFAGWSGDITDAGDPRYNFMENTSTPKINKISITTYELYAQPQITQKLLDDAFVDVESWLVEKIVETFSTKESEAFIKGNGNVQPKGILSYKDGKEYDEIEQIKTEKLDSDSLIILLHILQH